VTVLAGAIVKLPHKLLLVAPFPAVIGVLFFLKEQNHIYMAPGAEHIDQFYSILALLSIILLCSAAAIVLLAPIQLWKTESPEKLAISGMLLTAGGVLFAEFAYKAFILDGITTVTDYMWIFFVAPPASPAILCGVLTIIIAGVRHSRIPQIGQ
jgi:hypothetical protein